MKNIILVLAIILFAGCEKTITTEIEPEVTVEQLSIVGSWDLIELLWKVNYIGDDTAYIIYDYPYNTPDLGITLNMLNDSVGLT